MNNKFWESKKLAELNESEWEALCDGCGKCCLIRLEDPETLEVACTSISCKLFNAKTCECTNYEQRQSLVPTCLALNAKNISHISWLPKSCSYRLRNEGHPLPQWHHLICNDKSEIHRKKASMKNKTISEEMISEDDWVNYIIEN